MPRAVALPLGGFALVLMLLAASQVVLPGIAEREVEDRLEQDGGDARVSVSAFPALRLLFDDGESLEVEGEGLTIDPERTRNALERLDGFDRVSVRLRDVEAGPLELSRFVLERGEGQSRYETEIAGTTSPRAVGRFLGGFLGDLAAGSLPGGDTPVPVELEAVVESRDGEVTAREASGSVAGIPAGPLAVLVVEAVARRL